MMAKPPLAACVHGATPLSKPPLTRRLAVALPAACETVKVCPPTVIVPVLAPPGFAAAE